LRRFGVFPPRYHPGGGLVHGLSRAGGEAAYGGATPALGITTTQRLEEIIALRPDAAMWSAQGYDPVSIAQLLEAGINVYTGLGGYFLDGQPDQQLIEDACRKGRSTFAAGGNIPGLISDVLPIFLSGFTGDIRHITAVQRNHVAHYPSAAQLSGGLGLGAPAPISDAPTELDLGWEWLMAMSARMVAAALGLEFTDFRTTAKDVKLAPETVTLPGSGLTIEAGTVAGVRWTGSAYSADREFLTIVNEQTGVFGLGPDWRQDDSAPAWTVEIDASPPMICTLTWPDGVPAAAANSQLNAARAINVIEALASAPPGARSVLDLPMITGRGSLT
jgi:hypothetical protein